MGGERKDLTVIIVSFNSIQYIGLCLSSLLRQETTKTIEVIVVDNASTDGTAAFVNSEFPDVRIISNNLNHGFSRACNQGASEATGEHLLFLNPDTILAEDIVENSLRNYKVTENIGGLGLTLIDGSGAYLPESRRNIPTWENAFWKLSGNNRSSTQASPRRSYYAAEMQEGMQPTEVLSGAFFLISAKLIHF